MRALYFLLAFLPAAVGAEQFHAIRVFQSTRSGTIQVDDTLAAKRKVQAPLVQGDTGSFSVLGGSAGTTFHSFQDSSLSGFATTLKDTLRCSCSASAASCYQVAGISGTSNAAGFTFGTLTTDCRPSHTVKVPLTVVKNNSVLRIGFVSMASTGIGTVSWADTSAGVPTPNATFTSSGTKSIEAGSSFTFSKF